MLTAHKSTSLECSSTRCSGRTAQARPPAPLDRRGTERLIALLESLGISSESLSRRAVQGSSTGRTLSPTAGRSARPPQPVLAQPCKRRLPSPFPPDALPAHAPPSPRAAHDMTQRPRLGLTDWRDPENPTAHFFSAQPHISNPGLAPYGPAGDSTNRTATRS